MTEDKQVTPGTWFVVDARDSFLILGGPDNVEGTEPPLVAEVGRREDAEAICAAMNAQCRIERLAESGKRWG